MKILFIAAHPADLVDLAGGTIYNHAQVGDEVYTLAVTHGEFSHPPEDVKLLGSKYKIAEAKEALEMLSVGQDNMTWMNRGDALYLRNDYISNFPMTLCRDIAFHIQLVRPDILVTHHPTEMNHPDHGKVGQWTLEAAIAAGRLVDKLHVNNPKLKPHSVQNIYFYGYQFRPYMVKLGQNVLAPDVVVDITEAVKRKALAFVKLKSQFNTFDVVWERLNSMEKEIGRLYGFEYAESFISLYPARAGLLPWWGDSDFYSLLKEKAGQTQ